MRLTRPTTAAALFASTLLAMPAFAAEELPRRHTKPPGPALSAQDAMARMELPPGFKIEAVAIEPDVINPTSFTFDDRGRIWVTESVEYPRRSPGKGQDRVKILEDTDADGKVDKVTVFKDGLNIPCGVVHGNGGVYVTNAPDILFLQDTDNDGKADKEEVILTGFGRDDTHELPNSLTWGPDGWLYGMNGVFNQCTVKDPASGVVHKFNCAIWRYHPPTKRFELYAEGTSNPWGLDYNRRGDWFVSACVIDHMWHIAQSGYYHRQGGPYPPNVQMAKLGSIATQKHQQAAYAGLCIYDADVFPAEYRGRFIMGNLHGSALNQDQIARHGSTYRQSNVKDPDPNGKTKPETQTLNDGQGSLDFLQANDAWFMPVSMKVGPDGCMYLMDWYDRYHCYQDANRDSPGLDRLKGRIYRISYGDAPRAKPFDLAKETPADLIKHLSSPNVWWRRTAQRALNEHLGSGDIKPVMIFETLKQMALDPSLPNNANMHALWLLVSQNIAAQGDAFHFQLLSSPDAPTRDWGLRAIGNFQTASPELLAKMKEMAKADPDPAVRVQVAIAAGRLRQHHVDSVPVLLSLLEDPANAKDPLIPSITYLNLRPFANDRAADILAAIDKLPDRGQAFAETTVRWVKQAIATSGRGTEQIVADVAKTLKSPNVDAKAAGQALATLADGLAQLKPDERAKAIDKGLRERIAKYVESDDAGARVAAATVGLWWRDAKAVEAARKLVADGNTPIEPRVALAKTLAESKAAGNVEAFAAMAGDANVPVRLRQVAVDALGAANDKAAADALVARYKDMPADLKPATINALTRASASAEALVAALESKAIPLADVNANHVRAVQAMNNPTLAKRLADAWGTIKTDRDPERVKVVEEMRAVVAKHKGDPTRGWAAFNKTCAQCHTIYSRPGGNVGPDLTGVGRDDLTAILTNVVDPNLVIGKPYYVNVARTKGGDVIAGLLVEESPQQIVLRDQTGPKPIPRSELEKLTVQNVSMMPEGLEKAMSEQEFADLVAFLLTREPPKEPPAAK